MRRVSLSVSAALLGFLGPSAFAGSPTLLAPASAAYALPAPTGLQQVSSSPTTVKVSWKADAAATRFRVAYSETSDFSVRTNKETTATKFTITRLTANRSYYVHVRIISDDGTAPLSAWSKTTLVKTAQLLRVASFNVKAQDDSGSCKSWTTRRPVVAKEILDEKIDVVGLQEVISNDRRQELVDAVNQGGGNYGMTFLPTTKTGSGNRLLYNKDRVDLVTIEDHVFGKQDGNDTRRVIWGTFQLKSNQQKFLVFTTHLAPGGGDSLTKSQWTEVLDLAKKNGKGVPAIITGDFNTSKFNKPADTMLTAMKDGGFGDVLGQTYRSYTVSGQRAKSKTDAWINSFNDCDRQVKGVAKENIGNNIDWVFASNNLSVPKWKTVAPRDGSTLTTPIASDHFMLSAQILIPLS